MDAEHATDQRPTLRGSVTPRRPKDDGRYLRPGVREDQDLPMHSYDCRAAITSLEYADNNDCAISTCKKLGLKTLVLDKGRFETVPCKDFSI